MYEALTIWIMGSRKGKCMLSYPPQVEKLFPNSNLSPSGHKVAAALPLPAKKYIFILYILILRNDEGGWKKFSELYYLIWDELYERVSSPRNIVGIN